MLEDLEELWMPRVHLVELYLNTMRAALRVIYDDNSKLSGKVTLIEQILTDTEY